MSQVTATIMTPPVTVACSRASPTTTHVTMTPISGLTSTWLVWCGSAAIVDRKGLSEELFWPQHCATATTNLVPHAFKAYDSYALDYPQVSSCLSELIIPPIQYVLSWHLSWCLLSAFRFQFGCHPHQWRLNHWSLQCNNPLQYALGGYMCLLMMVHGPHQEGIYWLFLSLNKVEGNFMLLIQLSPSHSIHMVGHTALGASKRVILSLCLPYMVEMVLLLQVLFH